MIKSQKTVYNNVGGDIVMPVIFDVIIRPAEDVGGYWATCHMPDGGVNTVGDTIQEVENNMFESMDLYLEDYPEITEYSLNFEVHYA